MILSYGRPQYFPSVPTQRAFQKRVRALINCSSLDALKTLPAPALEIPGQVSFDNMLNCATCIVSLNFRPSIEGAKLVLRRGFCLR
jgi:hypothetical protein